MSTTPTTSITDKGAAKTLLTTAPDPMLPMTYFFILTSIYAVITLYVSDPLTKNIIKFCYILLVIMGEYFINLTLTEAMCGGEYQWNTALTITIIPWVMIFLVLQVFLYMFPGWLRPFSNTFGYGVVKLLGINDLMDRILTKPGEITTATTGDASTTTTSNEAKIGIQIANALENIRQDKSLLINELNADKDKFEGEIKNLKSGKIIKEPLVDKDKNDLYTYILQKNTVAEYIWNLLAGFLVTSVSYNHIVNTTCRKSVNVMKQQYTDYEEKMKKIDIEKVLKDGQKVIYSNGTP